MLYDEHKLDLSKARAAIAVAEDAARYVKGVSSKTLVAELVQLRAEIRRLRLKSEEGDEDTKGDAETLVCVAARGSRRSFVEDQSEEDKQMWMEQGQQQTEMFNKSVGADEETEKLLSRQREAEERENALLHERAALQTQLDELQAQVQEANKQVAIAVKSEHEQALALEKTQKECDALRQECQGLQRVSAYCNNHTNQTPPLPSAPCAATPPVSTPAPVRQRPVQQVQPPVTTAAPPDAGKLNALSACTACSAASAAVVNVNAPPALKEPNRTPGRGAHPARLSSDCEFGVDGKAQVQLEEERKRNRGQTSGVVGEEEELEELTRRLDEERKKMIMDLEEQLQNAQVNLAITEETPLYNIT